MNSVEVVIYRLCLLWLAIYIYIYIYNALALVEPIYFRAWSPLLSLQTLCKLWQKWSLDWENELVQKEAVSW